MTQHFQQERELGWDDTIVQDSEFVLLEPGEYWFTVEKFERARHTPNPNSRSQNPLPACNKAILTLKIDTRTGETKTVKHNLFLHSRTEGMVSAFFGAIGQKRHGEQLQMNWQTVVGSVGVTSIKKEMGSNGNEYNSTGYMIYSEDVDPTKQLNDRPGSTQSAYQQPQANYQTQPAANPNQPVANSNQQPAQNFTQQPPTNQPQQGYQPGAF